VKPKKSHAIIAASYETRALAPLESRPSGEYKESFVSTDAVLRGGIRWSRHVVTPGNTHTHRRDFIRYLIARPALCPIRHLHLRLNFCI
jgi:hypothetical protein